MCKSGGALPDMVSPAQAPLVPWEPSRQCFPKPWPKGGLTESLLSTGLNHSGAGNKTVGWHLRFCLYKGPHSASSKTKPSRKVPETVEAALTRHPSWLVTTDKLRRKQSETHFPLPNQPTGNPLPNCPKPPNPGPLGGAHCGELSPSRIWPSVGAWLRPRRGGQGGDRDGSKDGG